MINKDMEHLEPERHGKILLTVSISSILVWLVLSNGYDQRFGFLTNLYYTLDLYDSNWFCEEVVKREGLFETKTVTGCVNVRIATKYLVVISLIFATYGYLISRLLLPNPFPQIMRRIKEQLR